MLDLESIFGELPAATEPIPSAPAVTPVPRHGSVPEPDAKPIGGGSDFTRWVRRPDHAGRLGWEAPGIADADRWWARSGFDDLTEIPVIRPDKGLT